jgi:hypothetical protein
MNKLLIISVLLLISLIGCGGGGSSSPTPSPTPECLTFSDAGDMGAFDPSVARDPNSNRLWMSFSAVDQSSYYDPATYWGVSIQLAYSDDNGVSWCDAGVAASPSQTEATIGPMDSIPAETYGIWQSETSSLTYDPSANAGEEWKLVWHQYLHAGSAGTENSHFNKHGWLALKMASTPEGLAAATPIKLFGGVGLSTDGENSAAPIHSPIGGEPAIKLNFAQVLGVQGSNTGELLWCAFVEPSIFSSNTFIYMTMACADAIDYPTINEYIVHFRCASPCTMTTSATWEYMGRLLTPADAVAATGYHHYQAPAVIEKGESRYLVVTPVEKPSTTPYSGCRVYKFADINSNQLQRSSGELVEIAQVNGETGTHNGACGGFAGLEGGLFLSQFEPTNTPKTFRVYKSQVTLPDL